MRAVLASVHRNTFAWSQLGSGICRRLWPLDCATLCANARRRTGLEEFGNPPLDPALSVLLASLEQEAELGALGRFLMRVHLQDLLETRLRLEASWRKNEQRLDREFIKNPVFIVGMPRSGSTFLHELLTNDPNHRSPRVWEVLFPVAASTSPTDEAKRIAKAETCLWWFRRLAPRADAVYPMRAKTPQECVAIHSYTFLSEEFISTCRIPTYEAFLHRVDLSPAYQWQKRFLQHLQSGKPARRWVLKSPDHIYGLEQLFSVFPDAKVIQTHRNPVEVIRSSADLTGVLRGLYGPPGRQEELHEREARVLADCTERFIEFRDAHPELSERFIDVKYTDLIEQPLATLRQIYAQLQTPLSNEVASRLECLALNRSRYRGHRGRTEASVQKLGTGLEAARFERYCARFQLSFPRSQFRQ